MSAKPRPVRQIVCERCGRAGCTVLVGRDLCRACHRSEPSARCVRCGLMRHNIAEATGLCPRCMGMIARPESPCRYCGRVRVIVAREAGLCQPCQQYMRHRQRNKDKQVAVACAVCGKMRPSALLTRAVCQACWRQGRNGRGLCARCGHLKPIHIAAERLCKHCYADALAPKALRRYLADYSTPHPYNKVLLDLLTATIEWDGVTEKVDRRVRSFGRFLQVRRLDEPLTWEAIDAALPALGPTNRNNPKQIRACLLDLGHLLAARGELEGRETYVARRNALAPIIRAPAHVRELLHRYTAWLWERRTVPANVRDHLEALAAFWSWCDGRAIGSPREVQVSLINDYLLTLYWRWHCPTCQGGTPFEPRDRRAPKSCPHCGAVHTLVKAKGYAQNTVRGHRARLLVFFDWAKLNRMVVTNPVQRKTPAPNATITHYPPDVIKRLCAYVAAPDADPLEALILYLILFHALSVQELRHAQIPTLLSLHEDVPLPTLTDAYYAIVPKSDPSLGDCSPGRPDTRLDFLPKAEPWLKPLLRRFEQWRRTTIKNPANRHLLVSPGQSRHIMPVGYVFVWQVVRRASLRVLGATCTPNTLRKTVGVMFADRAGAGILRWMGWDDQQAFAYTWAERTMIQPQPMKDSTVTDPWIDPEPLIFPSPREGRITCDD